MRKQSFFTSTIILTISGIVCKIMGAIYKIPLTHILGSLGTGIYYLVFPIYAFLLTFVSHPYTIALSRLVSVHSANGEYYLAKRTLYATLVLLIIQSAILAVLLCFFSHIIARVQGLESAHLCYFALAPAIVAVAVSSSFKGFFQGLQNMTPSATSQILEQVVKLSLGFVLANLFIGHGAVSGTLGALIGISISEVVSALFFVAYYVIFNLKNKQLFTKTKQNTSFVKLIAGVFKSALPFILTSLILPLSMVVDSFLIINILKNSGFDKYFSTSLLGLNSGIVNTIVALPSTLSSALCMTIVPYISYALSNGNNKEVEDKASLAHKFTIIIALPCVFVFALFSKQIISLLYNMDSVYQFNITSTLLMISSINVLYLALLQISTSILQAINRPYIPVISLSVALAFKVIFEVVLISNPYINISGAVVATSVCYMLSSGINLVCIRRYFAKPLNLYQQVISPLFCSLIMSLCVYLTYYILKGVSSSSVSILLSFFSGFVVYVVCIFLFRTFTQKERDTMFKFRVKRSS